MHNIIAQMKQGFDTAYINQDITSNLAFRPQFISNNYKEGRKVLSALENELLGCEEFYISVAFITMSGLTPLLQTLKELEAKGIKGKILTTDYLTFSEPKALKKLASFQNIEVKMYCSNLGGDGFHTKGYIFKKEEVYQIIVGSSNITMGALTKNQEWNTRIISTEKGEYASHILKEYQSLWESCASLQYKDFIDTYSEYYDIVKKQKQIAKQSEIPSIEQYRLQPNNMQVQFVKNLKQIMQADENKALLISATGERVIIVTGRRSPVKSRTWAA